jgi:hypothetical protein
MMDDKSALAQLMNQDMGVEGRWYLTEDREPERPALYNVIRRRDSGCYTYEMMIWRGYWLDLSGRPKKAPAAWYEEVLS